MFGGGGFGLAQEITDTPTYNYDGSSAGNVRQTTVYYDYTPPVEPTPVSTPVPVDGGSYTAPVSSPITNSIATGVPANLAVAANATLNKPTQPKSFLDLIAGLFTPDLKDANGNLITSTTAQAVTPKTPIDTTAAELWVDVQNFYTRNQKAIWVSGGLIAAYFLISEK